jgi:adenylate cyclase
VLPFSNLSEDQGQQYFADGITEDVTTDLSRLAGMLVISRNTAFTYRSKSVDTRQIGRELCVRYVLEGSVRRADNRVRVNAQLIDAETDTHLWAERFDGEASDLLALQDEITGRIANALNLALIGAEAARLTQHPDAVDYIFRGRAAFHRPPTRDSLAKAIGLFEHALALDPHSVAAQSWLARTLVGRVSNNMTDTKAADIAWAEEQIAQALAVSPGYPVARYTKGFLLATQNRRAEAIPEFEAVVASDRNWAAAIAQLGRCRFLAGST